MGNLTSCCLFPNDNSNSNRIKSKKSFDKVYMLSKTFELLFIV